MKPYAFGLIPAATTKRWRELGLVDDRTLGQAFESAAHRWSDSIAIAASETHPAKMTLAQIFTAAKRVAAGLQALGVTQNDVVAVQLPGWLEAVVAHGAIALLGGTVVPIVHSFGAGELSFILRQSGAKAIITPGVWLGTDRALPVASVEQVPALRHHIVLGESSVSSSISWNSLASSEAEFQEPDGTADDLAMIVYTSGTTAAPKGVCHSHRSLLAEAKSLLDASGRRGFLNPWPPGHIAGYICLMNYWVSGVPIVMMDRWHGVEAARLIEKYRLEATSGTPLHLGSLLDAADAEGRDLSSLTDYLAGATTIPAALIARCAARGLATYRAYGLSEHPTVSRGSPLDPLDLRLNSDGRLCPGVEVRIVDEAGQSQPPGCEGEILSRGPDRFLGYTDPALNEAAFAEGGWFRTGDIGRLDTAGNLSITDRKKDVIIRGGETLSSREIEELIAALPVVREVAVIGLPDPRLGERICAVISLEENTELSLDAVDKHFHACGVARHKTPERLVVVADFPRTPAGKIKKNELRQQLQDV